MATQSDHSEAQALSNQVDTFVPPAYEPQQPGFRFPEKLSVGELYAKGKQNPCGDWCIDNFWSGGNHRIECQLALDHEYELGLPHISFDNSKAWRAGVITDVWYKDNSAPKDKP